MSLRTERAGPRGLALALAAVIAIVALDAAPADAHAVGLSRGEYHVTGGALRVDLAFARGDALALVPALDMDRSGSLSTAEVAAGGAALTEAIVSRLEVRGRTGACAGALDEAALVEQDGLTLGIHFDCGLDPGPLSIHVGFLDLLPAGHRHLASVMGLDGRGERVVVYEARPDFQLAGAASTAAGVALPLLRLGVQHILTGYDHLVFLLGLILVGGRLRSLMVVVTAFTLAHSITLALAALGVWAPSPRLVEPAIALSIAYVGVENWFVRDAGRRWLVTFPFGLVHGFGFAGALREIALPAAQVPVALVSFNAGVEAGQLGVLLVALPLVLWLRRRSWFAEAGVRVASALIVVAGLAWFVTRITS